MDVEKKQEEQMIVGFPHWHYIHPPRQYIIVLLVIDGGELVHVNKLTTAIKSYYRTLQEASNTTWLEAKKILLPIQNASDSEDFGFSKIRLSLPSSSSITTVFSRLSRSWMSIKISLADSIQYSFTLSVSSFWDAFRMIIFWRWSSFLRMLI